MISKILRELKGGNILVLLHANADPDAVGSGYALAECFPNVTLGVPKGVNKKSKRMIERLGIDVEMKPKLKGYNKIVVLDTSTRSLLGELAAKIKNPIIIDHHAKTNWPDARLYWCEEKSTSCAEMVYKLLKKRNFLLPRGVALALLTGILTDSGGFKRATTNTLRIATELMEGAKIEVKDAFDLIGEPPTRAQRVALLKGAQRLSFVEVNNYLLAYSKIGAFESALASMLIKLGADVALVGRQKNDEFILIAKAAKEFPVHLGKLLATIDKGGGGHRGAAGITSRGDVEHILKRCINSLKEKLKSL